MAVVGIDALGSSTSERGNSDAPRHDLASKMSALLLLLLLLPLLLWLAVIDLGFCEIEEGVLRGVISQNRSNGKPFLRLPRRDDDPHGRSRSHR